MLQSSGGPRNLTMLSDFYEFTMMGGYLENGLADTQAVFDVFFRGIPDGGGFAIFAGLEQALEFLAELRDCAFCCDVGSVLEGTPVFPNEPLITVRGPLPQVQLIETMLLLSVNFQTLIATKTSRIVRAAQGRAVVEFGARRAQSYDASVLGARAAYIAGAVGTSKTIVDTTMGIPAAGTMAHSWVQVFDSEYDAFKAYAEVYPDNCTLLIDTYNVMRSGLPNAIRVFDEVVVPKGFRPKAVRIDSGDLAYLSNEIRRTLDEAGYRDVRIMASNALDEYIIRDLLLQNAQIDIFGVGENLITSKTQPVFGGVYKLAAVEKDGVMQPKIKISESVEKLTVPGFKKVYRLYSRDNGKMLADYITLRDETVDDSRELTIFDPRAVWKRKTLTNFEARELQVQVMKDGKRCADSPSIEELRAYCAAQMDTLWEESKRFEYPHRYYVDLSQKLWDTQQKLLGSLSGR